MTAKHKKKVSVPVSVPWLAALPLAAENPGTVHFAFPRPARAVLRKRKPVKPSVWAERHRVVTMSSLPGPWKNSVTPYLAGIMDLSFFPSVRKVIVCKAPQTGMTEGVINCLGYVADRDPGPALCVFPDRDMSRENATDRIKPMLESSPQLQQYLTGNPDDLAANKLAMVHMPIYMAWAHSPSRLANKPVKYLVLDEVDKYPPTAGKKEASPIALAEARVTVYPDDYKEWLFSSPTTVDGPIWQAITTEAAVVGRYTARCPHCSADQVMEFSGIRIPDDQRDPVQVMADRSARYVCAQCGSEWDDHQRDLAVKAGQWSAWHLRNNPETGEPEFSVDPAGRSMQRYIKDERPETIGFHLPSWLSRFVSLSKVMAAFLRGTKDKIALRDFNNKHGAWPWVLYRSERPETAILALQDDRPRGVPPGGGVVAGLVAGVDTQDNGFFYTIWAIGFGDMVDGVPVSPMWLVAEGFVLSFSALAEVLWSRQYADADGRSYPVQFTLQDSAGHRTSEVYDFCRNRPWIMPAKGERTMAQRYAYSALEYYPGSRKKIPGGLTLCRVNTTMYKDNLDKKLQVHPGDPGGIRLYNGQVGEQNGLDGFAAQMCAEAKDENGWWVQTGNRPNHYWDCTVLAMVAADIRGITSWVKRDPEPDPPENEQTEKKQQTKKGGRW